MAEIRLNKIIRQFNVGLDDLVGFLRKIGVEVEANPNGKICRPSADSSAKTWNSSRQLRKWISR